MPFWKDFICRKSSPPLILTMIVLLRIYVSVSTNVYELYSVLYWKNMNIRLQWDQMKLQMQYVNSFHLVVIFHLSNWFLLWWWVHTRKSVLLFGFSIDTFCNNLTFSYANKPRICLVSLIDLERSRLEMILGNFNECESNLIFISFVTYPWACETLFTAPWALLFLERKIVKM